MVNSREPEYVHKRSDEFDGGHAVPLRQKAVMATEPRRHFVDRFGNKTMVAREPQQLVEKDLAAAV